MASVEEEEQFEGRQFKSRDNFAVLQERILSLEEENKMFREQLKAFSPQRVVESRQTEGEKKYSLVYKRRPQKEYSVNEEKVYVEGTGILDVSDEDVHLPELKGKQLKQVQTIHSKVKKKCAGKSCLTEVECEAVVAFLHSIDCSKYNMTMWTNGIYSCTVKDMLEILSVTSFISLDVFMVYFSILEQRQLQSPNEYKPSIFLSGYIQGLLATRGAEVILKKTLERSSLNDFQYIFVPLHTNNHLHLLVVDLEGCIFYHFNSLSTSRTIRHTFDSMVHWISQYLDANAKRYLRRKSHPILDWSKVEDDQAPGQANSVDCGIFVMKYVEYLHKDTPWDWTQKDMDRFRGEIAAIILTDPHRMA